MRSIRLQSFTLVLAILLVVAPTVAAQVDPTATPPTWVPPVVVKSADVPCCDPGTVVTFTIVVTNPGTPPAATWYNVRVTDPIDPIFEIVSATTTLGTATIDSASNTVIVDGGITLAPQQSFAITIVVRVVGTIPPGGTVIINTAYVEYDDPDGQSWGPIYAEEPVRLPAPCGEVVIPEASTLILLGSAATGLAGYVGLQIRARRRNRK
jgi:uncharacterized repeat protein (TIGR01451 family)